MNKNRKDNMQDFTFHYFYMWSSTEPEKKYIHNLSLRSRHWAISTFNNGINGFPSNWIPICLNIR